MRITFVFNSKYAWATLKKVLSCAGRNNPTITTKHSFSPSDIFHLPTSSKIHPKQAAHQQVGSSRDASLSKLDNKVNKNPIFNKMHAEVSTIWQVLLLFLPPNFFTQGHSLLCNLLFSVGLFYSIMMQNVVILLLIFGIMLFTEWYRVLVLHLSLLTVFI